MKLLPNVAAAFYGNFPALRPAQQAAIAPLLAGKNIILTAGTGSGKTEAVTVPLVSRYYATMRDAAVPVILYIAPTKALVNDLLKRLEPRLTELRLRAGIRHGDRNDLSKSPAPQLLITTPESVEVVLQNANTVKKFAALQAVIIDEAHLLYNTQRGMQLAVLLCRLRKTLGRDLQMAALSATVGDLAAARDFLWGKDAAAELLPFPAQRAIQAKVFPAERLVEVVKNLVVNGNKILVFTNKRKDCDKLAAALQKENELRDSIFAHYSSMSDEERRRTEAAFAARKAAVCLATSTLELGIDIGDIDAVALYHCPHSVDAFLQRIGRGNRRTAKTCVLGFIGDDRDDNEPPYLEAWQFAALLNAAQNGELSMSAPHELFGAAAQQIFSVIAANDGAFLRIADLCEMFVAQPHLDRPAVENILAELAKQNFLQKHGYKNAYGADEKLHRLAEIKMLYGNFPLGAQKIQLTHQGQSIGEAPAENLLRWRDGDKIAFAGRAWKIKRITPAEAKLEIAADRNGTVEIYYGGNKPAIAPADIDRIWRVLHGEPVPGEIWTRNFAAAMVESQNAIKTHCALNELPYCATTDGVLYFTFAGEIINRALAKMAGATKAQANDFCLEVAAPLDWKNIAADSAAYADCFRQLFDAPAGRSYFQELLPIELQQREFLEPLLKDPAIPRILTRLRNSRPRAFDRRQIFPDLPCPK
ncbi:ATP-dependent helicase [Planctomycetales bacterium]|nr:ATP-dependent helicase [Planctomycetales bacterium]